MRPADPPASPCFPAHPNTQFPPPPQPLLSQEKRIVDEIETYFNHPIPAVPYDDEDEFVRVLRDAGLTEQEDL